jgi:hypothetical protein
MNYIFGVIAHIYSTRTLISKHLLWTFYGSKIETFFSAISSMCNIIIVFPINLAIILDQP